MSSDMVENQIKFLIHSLEVNKYWPADLICLLRGPWCKRVANPWINPPLELLLSASIKNE